MVESRTYSMEELEEITGFNQRTIAYYIQQGLLPKVGRRGRSTRYPHLFVERLRFIEQVRALQDAGRLGSVTLPRIAAVICYLAGHSADGETLPDLDEEQMREVFEDPRIEEERFLGLNDEGDEVFAEFGRNGPSVRVGDETVSIEAEEVANITLDDALARLEDRDSPSSWRTAPRRSLSRSRASARRERMRNRMAENMSDFEGVSELEEAVEKVAMLRASIRDFSPEKAAPRDDRSERIAELVREIERVAERQPLASGGTERWTRVPLTRNMEISIRTLNPRDGDLLERLALELKGLLEESAGG
jgi:hypothetical protein